MSRPIQTDANAPGSEFGRQVPVDLEADADLNEGRGSPRHWSSPSVSRYQQGRSGPAAAQAPPRARREHKRLRSAQQRENRTLAGPVCSSSARGPTITFQRGTADGATIAIWEDGQPSAASHHSMPLRFSHTMQRLACQPCGYREARRRRCSSLPREQRLEMPALRLRHQKVAEHLHARDRLELFRIDEIGIERDRRVGLAEQLHQSAVLFDQIIRQ